MLRSLFVAVCRGSRSPWRCVGGAPSRARFPTPPPVPPPQPVDRDYFRDERHRSVPLLREHEGSGRGRTSFKDRTPTREACWAGSGRAARSSSSTGSRFSTMPALPFPVVRDDGPYYFYEKLKPGENSPKLYVREAAGGDGTRAGRSGRARDAPANTSRSTTSCRRSDGIVRRVRDLRRRLRSLGDPRRRNGDRQPSCPTRSTARTSSARRAGCPTENRSTTCASRSSQPGEPENDKETRAVNYLHVLGRDPDRDVPVFGYGVNPKVTFETTDFPIVVYSPASKYTIGSSCTALRTKLTIYATRGDRVRASGDVPWKRVVDRRRRRDRIRREGFDDLLAHAPRRADVQGRRDLARRAELRERADGRRGEQSRSSMQLGVAADGLYVRSR